MFKRTDKRGKDLVVLLNFAPVARRDYRIGVPEAGVYTEVFTSDDVAYGGGGLKNGRIETEEIGMHGFGQSIRLTVPPLSAVCFELWNGGNSK